MSRISTPPRARVAWLALAVVVLAAGATSGRAEPRSRVALLPFENVSGSLTSTHIVMPLLRAALQQRGYEAVDARAVEAFLFKNRIRSTGMLGRRHLDMLRRELGVGLAMVGVVALYNDSETNPQWGLVGRMLSTDDGAIAWSATAGLTGGDFTHVLGLGTITSGEELAGEVVNALAKTLPPAGTSFAAPKPRTFRGLPFVGLRPGYRSPTLDVDPPRRVAVLPFENLSERKGAARIVTDVFVTALFHHGRFQVIEPGTVSDALVAIGAAPFGLIDLETLALLRKQLEMDAVVVGTVYNYNEGLKKGPTTSPEVEVDARMLEAETGRILWYAGQSRAGEDSQIVLEFGKIRAVVPLVLKVTAEIAGTL